MTGVEEFNAALDELQAGIMAATEEWANLVAPYLRGVLRPEHSSGKLSGSIEAEVIPTETAVTVRVGPTAPHTRMIELGHKKTPHRPSFRKARPWFRVGFEPLGGALQRGWVENCARVIGAI